MNLIYMRPSNPKAKKFIKMKLRGDENRSIYDMEEGDCCLAPAPVGKHDYMVTFLNDVTPDMLDFIYLSAAWSGLDNN